MAYVAVKGGSIAIEESIKRLNYLRVRGENLLEVETIKSCLRGLVDICMSEASLYDRDLASIAIKQAEGSSEEAVFLLRAYRSTLSRKYISLPICTSQMHVKRRISASFKDIPGGQILGASHDYTHRLIDFDLASETKEQVKNAAEIYLRESENDFKIQGGEGKFKSIEETEFKLPRVMEHFYSEGILERASESSALPEDITKQPLTFPAARSQRLQTMARSQAGALQAFAYAAIRGYSDQHPTVAELRFGSLPVFIEDPLSQTFADQEPLEDDQYYIGSFDVTETESLIPMGKTLPNGDRELSFGLGYGLCFGQNETKSISMSIMDSCLENKTEGYLSDEEFVLMHIDSVESTGFISHLKLPHYVTFASEMDAVKKSKKQKGAATDEVK